MKKISLFLVIIFFMIGVCGCMDNDQLHETQTRKESDVEYAQMMLEHMEKKYNEDFEIIKYIFPEVSFNSNHLQNILLVKESKTGIITNVYATMGTPYTYYDNYVSDKASWINRQLVDCTPLEGLGTTKLYLYLRNEDANTPDIAKENVSRVVLVVNITREPDTYAMEKLYGIYQELFTLDYEYVFLAVGFTEQCKEFDNYVHFYRVFGKKSWEDYNGDVYATLSAKDAGLTFEAFQDLCTSK